MASDDNREYLLDSWLALVGDGPMPDHPLRLPVLSGSMVPEIPVGSVIHIEKTTARRCRTGDVVVYRDGDRLVVHRVLLRLGWGSTLLFYEKGDANDLGNWIKGERIRGLVLAVDLREDQDSRPIIINPARARSSLGADFRHRVLALPRRIKRLLLGSGD